MPTVLSRHLLPDYSPYFAHALHFSTIHTATQQPRQGQEWARAPVYKKIAPPHPPPSKSEPARGKLLKQSRERRTQYGRWLQVASTRQFTS